jgi:hypothetical protein
LKCNLQANESFSQIGRLTMLVKEFSGVFPSLDNIIEHKESLITMQRLLENPSLQSLFTTMSNVSFNFDIDQFLNEFGSTEVFAVLSSKAPSFNFCLIITEYAKVNEFNLKDDRLRQFE